ncbi:DUF445 family protein [Eubacteriaceae bacterium ES3]|nr:DUF445 family protein [Eubacteriaceae bacterium ES3]
MITKLIAGPLIGGIIGFITNGIAIRMLFRPLEAVYLFGFQVPFTPGLIPKEKPNIARSLGQVVAKHLLNEETLKRGLTSEELDEKILTSVDHFLNAHQNSDKTIKDLILSFVGTERGLAILEKTEVKIVAVTYQKMQRMELGPMISELAMESISQDLNNSMFSMFISDSLIDSVQKKMSSIIDSLVNERGEEVIQTIVEKETDEWLNLKINDLITHHQDKIPEYKQTLLDTYHQIIEKHSRSLVQALNLGKLVEEQIIAFDVLSFEKLLLEIMNKELKAIILLGGLLGAVMGLVMSFL